MTGSASGTGIQTWTSPGTQIVITDAGFDPQTLNISVNTAVTFINKGSNVHSAVTVQGTNPTFNTGGLAPGQSANFYFTIPGTFGYQSDIGNDKIITTQNGTTTVSYKLQGTIVVQSGAAASSSPSPSSAPSASAAPSAGPCQFILGFATMAANVSQVGQCTDNQSFAANGDALQHTTGGLLVWRKSDNWTAFTDGYRTWVNGPNGIQERLNTDRFPWEH
ncbi:MAG TPA: hypothetical protein VK009_28675 [Chloroflexota bacterium]|nr:hypothetical protein [Chloroflexota bacterium]